MSKHSPVEAKTISSTGASAGAVTISGFIVWLLAVTVWGADWHDVSLDTVKVVPGIVISMVFLVVVPGITGFAGWLTHHTPRPLEPAKDNAVPVVPGPFN